MKPRSAQFESRKTFKYATEAELEKARTIDVNRGPLPIYKVHWKPKSQFSAIKASIPLILQEKRRF